MTCTKELLDVMARLRHPESGCPWDLKQDFASIAPYTIEEAYEVADAIERNDLDDLRSELGDLLFQVVFHARMAEERGAFTYGDVVAGIVDKMVHRHPHVFGGEDSEAWEPVEWERRKLSERGAVESILDGISTALPELARAMKLQKRAAAVGFDWPDTTGVFEKLREEIRELETAQLQKQDTQRIADELGDLLFACVNLARHLGVDPGRALRGGNSKFDRRFRRVEQLASARGASLADLALEEMEQMWVETKRGE
jgi:ATP diphosphatase